MLRGLPRYLVELSVRSIDRYSFPGAIPEPPSDRKPLSRLGERRREGGRGESAGETAGELPRGTVDEIIRPILTELRGRPGKRQSWGLERIPV